jgi:hypothetical protein
MPYLFVLVFFGGGDVDPIIMYTNDDVLGAFWIGSHLREFRRGNATIAP